MGIIDLEEDSMYLLASKGVGLFSNVLYNTLESLVYQIFAAT